MVARRQVLHRVNSRVQRESVAVYFLVLLLWGRGEEVKRLEGLLDAMLLSYGEIGDGLLVLIVGARSR
jgi:hypothetical protein